MQVGILVQPGGKANLFAELLQRSDLVAVQLADQQVKTVAAKVYGRKPGRGLQQFALGGLTVGHATARRWGT